MARWGSMEEGTTVWAARLGAPEEGVKGSLTLLPGRLAFDPEKGDLTIRIPLTDIRRVRRIYGSPVMIVEHGAGTVAFYFAQPPPIITSTMPLRNRRDRAISLGYLRDSNATLRGEIKGLVRRIKEAVRNAKG